MKASVSSILEYQSDQPSMKPLRPLSLLLHSQPKTNGPPFTFLLRGRSISGRGELRPPVRRSRPTRTVPTMSDDAPALTIPTAARRRSTPTVLAPDEDATMAPSEF